MCMCLWPARSARCPLDPSLLAKVARHSTQPKSGQDHRPARLPTDPSRPAWCSLDPPSPRDPGRLVLPRPDIDPKQRTWSATTQKPSKQMVHPKCLNAGSYVSCLLVSKQTAGAPDMPIRPSLPTPARDSDREELKRGLPLTQRGWIECTGCAAISV
jgi:hypothetical protein